MTADALPAAAFEALLQRTGGDILLLVDPGLRIVRVGGEAERLAERPAGNLAGMSLIAAFGSASLDAVARSATLGGSAVTGEAELGPQGGRLFEINAVPVAGGSLVLWLHDITALRRLERVRRDFVANISHELRTPLTSIKLLAETVSSGAVDDPATASEFALQIEREVDHLVQLVDELLDLTMIESGQTRLNLEPLDPDDVVAGAAQRIGPVAERRDMTVRAVPDTEMQPGTRAIGDATRLGQALLNLAHNAVKYSQPGGEVRIGWRARPGRIRFIVADDGIGVPEAHQARIFERFYKVDRSRAREEDPDERLSGSAGLGLAIVRQIAEAHGGTVGLESVERVGSTFWIEVPRAPEPGADA
ncbi:MAG: cell wall metabolism sensor histidine kinase WalK [Chloroflexota bacterium]|nr:cell wall metabolism sensor histidine kinase WalK [Chloroflexota bacterium]